MSINISKISLSGIALGMLVLVTTASEAVFVAALYVIMFLLSLFVDHQLMDFCQKLVDRRFRRAH